jgi:hypothetical protein
MKVSNWPPSNFIQMVYAEKQGEPRRQAEAIPCFSVSSPPPISGEGPGVGAYNTPSQLYIKSIIFNPKEIPT